MLSSTVSTKPTRNNRFDGRRAELAIIAGILCVSAFLNLYNLNLNGWGNAYYSAAVQSGLHDSESFIFGSSDWGNSISVDKPPLSLWLMGLSVRVFGLNSWGILISQALLGVASTFVVYAIARNLSAAAGLVAASIYGTTPVVVLMSRYNNPDPLMIFLMLASMLTVLKALNSGRARWAALSGVLLGLAVLTKELQALFVAPSIAILVLGMARRERGQTMRTALAFVLPFMLVSASWFIALRIIPGTERPFLGSTTSNDPLELTFGFNGLQRLQSIPNPGAALMPASSADRTDAGPFRLLNPDNAQEAGWLLSTAFIALLLIVAERIRSTRRAGLPLVIAVGVWFLVVYVALSFMGNGYHTYYSLSLAPPLAILIGGAASSWLSYPKRALVRWLAGAGILTATLSTWLILGSLAEPPVALRTVILVLGTVSTALTVIGPPGTLFRSIAIAAASAILTGPILADFGTISRSATGALPASGMIASNPLALNRLRQAAITGVLPQGLAELAYGRMLPQDVNDFLSRADPSCLWAAATIPAQSAANIQLAIGRPVMPLGGYQAADPWPTQSQFQDWVGQHKVCYLVDEPALDLVATDQSEAGRTIRWVRASFDSVTVDGVALYDLRRPRT